MNSDTQMLKATPKAWLVWFLAAMFVFYMFMLQASTSVMIPQLMKDFHLSVTEIGVLSASFFYPYLLLQIPAGVIIDRMGIARPLVFSLILCGLATFAFAIATSSLVLEVSRLIMGMASAPAVVCGMCLASRWFPKSMFPMLAGGCGNGWHGRWCSRTVWVGNTDPANQLACEFDCMCSGSGVFDYCHYNMG